MKVANLKPLMDLLPSGALHPDATPSDDGLLTLAEFYNLDLSACELAVHCACVTNFGPQNHGEGTWAISRGFLVAGNFRVVVSTTVAFSSARECGNEVNYAVALEEARRWTRQHGKWSSPFY